MDGRWNGRRGRDGRPRAPRTRTQATAGPLRPASAISAAMLAAGLLAGLGLGVLIAAASPSGGAGTEIFAAAVRHDEALRLALLGVLVATFALMLSATVGLWRQAARAVRLAERPAKTRAADPGGAARS